MRYNAYIGIFSNTVSKGIYLCNIEIGGKDHGDGDGDVDNLTAKLSVKLVDECVCPSYLYLTPQMTDSAGKTHRYLLAAIEAGEYKGHEGGAIRSYEVMEDMSLRFISEQFTDGGSPCHVICDTDHRFAILSNYGGGFASVFGIEDGFNLTPCVSRLVQKDEQEPERISHVHQAIFSPDGKYLVITDLGLDRVVFYDFDSASGVGEMSHIVKMPSGSGPRHTVFDTSDGRGEYFYTVCELSSEVAFCKFDENGVPLYLHSLSTLSLPSFTSGADKSYCAAIRMTPDGKIIVSNRGENTLAVFDASEPRFAYAVECGGDFPRDFAFTSDGKYILCANQKSGTLDLFAYEHGMIKDMVAHCEVDAVCAVEWA